MSRRARHRAPTPPIVSPQAGRRAVYALGVVPLLGAASPVTGELPAIPVTVEAVPEAVEPITSVVPVSFGMETITEIDATEYEARLRAEEESARQEAAEAARERRAPGRRAAEPAPSRSSRHRDPAPVIETVSNEILAASDARTAALAIGERYIGVPYVFGGTDPDTGLDCSAFVRLVFRELGVDLPRTSREQARVGTRVNASDARPGDLVFFGSPVHHVGIYAGNGRLLEARKAGVPVGYGDMWHSETIQYRRL